jgi:hypothetical protein
MTVALKNGFSTVIWSAEGPVGGCPLISPVAAENIKTGFTCVVIVVTYITTIIVVIVVIIHIVNICIVIKVQTIHLFGRSCQAYGAEESADSFLFSRPF